MPGVSCQKYCMQGNSICKQAQKYDEIISEESSENLLAEIDIANSRFTSSLQNQPKNKDVPKTKPISQEQNKNCVTCQKWKEWTQFSEKKLLKLESQLIQKQILLNQLIRKLQDKIIAQNKQIKMGFQIQQKLREQYERKISKLQSIVTEKSIQNQELKKKVFIENKGYKRSQQTIPTKKTIKMNPINLQICQNLQTQKNMKYSEMACERFRKSHTQQTVTQCSFLADYQNIENLNSRQIKECNNRNSQKISKIQKSLQKQNLQLQKELKKVKFENQNLKQYNKVLLAKLSQSKPKKY